MSLYITISLLAISAACALPAAPSQRKTQVGDSLLRIELTYGDQGITETHFQSHGQEIPGLQAIPWRLTADTGVIEPNGTPVILAGNLAGSPARHARFESETQSLKWSLVYELTGPGRITKTLTLTPKGQFSLQRVALWNAASPDSPRVARTALQDIAAFHGRGKSGLFVSLDFPYSRIETSGEHTTVEYPPFDTLAAGKAYTCHSLTIGATHLTGRVRYGRDEGEVAAMDDYVQHRYQPRFERPMFVSCSIINRYTQPAGGVVWYTMKDHPTLNYNTDLLKRELALMPQLGMEYYQVFPGVFDYGPDDPKPDAIRDIVDYSHKHGVRIGDYSSLGLLFCPHYNEYRNTLDRPEWLIVNEDGKTGHGFCFGDRRHVDYYAETVAANCRRYGFELHCLDFLGIAPCYSESHGHPPGPDSVYHQVRGLLRAIEAINAVSPKMMTWSNSGNWQQFLPKIAWTNPNLYLTDPFIATPWQGLNMTRLLDDSRREQMVSLHHTHCIPYRFLTNCQYFFSQNSIVPDIRNYQYGALSTLAVTPNLCLAEIRPWLDRLPDTDRQRVLAFYKHWTGFVAKHYDLWKKTCQAGENPGVGSVEIYSHAEGDGGFVFVVNPQYWDRTVEVPLDSTLGFSGAGRCEVVELHPTPRLRLTAQGPFATLGTRLPVTIAARQVLVLEIRPAPRGVLKPRLYGVPGSIEAADDGYLVRTHGLQGTTERFAVLLPPGSPRIAGAAVRPDVPKQPNRLWAGTPIKLLASRDEGALIEVTFRRERPPTELRHWTAKPGSLADGLAANWQSGFEAGEALDFPLFVGVGPSAAQLPITDARADDLGLGPLAGFCGGYIDNAFGETQETWIDLNTGPAPAPPEMDFTSAETAPSPRPLHPLAKDGHTGWWLRTSFDLPFMYTLGSEPAFDEHTILVLPFIRQARVREIKAWANGAPLDVRAYHYPRNRNLACFYADLVGTSVHGGHNDLVIHFDAAP